MITEKRNRYQLKLSSGQIMLLFIQIIKMTATTVYGRAVLSFTILRSYPFLRLSSFLKPSVFCSLLHFWGHLHVWGQLHFEVIFIFEVVFIFEVILILEVVFIFVLVFIFQWFIPLPCKISYPYMILEVAYGSLTDESRYRARYSGISLVHAIWHLTILTKVWLNWILWPHE